MFSAALSVSCITTYRDFPKHAVRRPALPEQQDRLYYNVKKFPVLDVGGFNALHKAFKNSGIARNIETADEPPAKGTYCLVEVEYKPLSLPALIFGYLSFSTLTLLPAYSGEDGYRVNYRVYKDGQPVKTYRYEVTRKVGLWLFLLPLSWINLGTYSEAEAFQTTAHQFFIEARKDQIL